MSTSRGQARVSAQTDEVFRSCVWKTAHALAQNLKPEHFFHEEKKKKREKKPLYTETHFL